MVEEEWKDIPGYEELYQASNLGNIKSLRNNIILKTAITRGYKTVALWKDKHQKTRTVHQLIAISFMNHTPDGFSNVINHIDFDKLNNATSNLEIITSRENSDKKHLKSSSKYTGVSWNSSSKKWQSAIFHNKKAICLGYFTLESEAKKYYDDALESIKNNTEIKIKRYRRTSASKYKGVSWNKKYKKWFSYVRMNKKRYYLGYFDDEDSAYDAILQFKDKIQLEL